MLVRAADFPSDANAKMVLASGYTIKESGEWIKSGKLGT